MGKKEVTPFNVDSEEEVRVALAFYFSDLGFNLGDMSFEDTFRVTLGHNSIIVGKNTNPEVITGRSDMLLMHNGEPLAMVETKAPGVKLNKKDRDQARSYARLLEKMPPYTILTNGKDFEVIDTFTALPITTDSPEDSLWWQNGRSFNLPPSESQENFLKKLLGLNFDVLKRYCLQQMAHRMQDLKSSNSNLRHYSPELYVPRQTVKQLFENFLNSDLGCFALIGDSGAGKTNELCYLAESYSKNEKTLVLFYRGVQLSKGLITTIFDDFYWEFESNEKIPQILKRLVSLARQHEAKVLIFIDGLDEYPDNIGKLAEELKELITHIDFSVIRICVSCKTLDWPQFVYDRGDYSNTFSEIIYPEKKQLLDEVSFPGFQIKSFSEQELSQAWIQYQKKFKLTGALKSETRQICQIPLMLRIISEVYEETNFELPSNLNNWQIFEMYWQKIFKPLKKDEARIAEQILYKFANLLVKRDEVTILKRDFDSTIDPVLLGSSAYDELLRYSVLIVESDSSSGESRLSLRFNKFLSFIYSQKIADWQNINDSQTLVESVKEALSTHLGQDAVLFHLSAVGDYVMLSQIIELDLPLFFEIMRSASNLEINLFEKPILNDPLEQFLFAYNRLTSHFPALQEKIIPYSNGQVGLWIYNQFHGFRLLTEEYPQRVVNLDDRTFAELIRGTINEETHLAFMPLDTSFSNTLWDKLEKRLPTVVAYNMLMDQISIGVKENNLNEGTNIPILSERVNNVIRSGPIVSFENSPKGDYKDFLGYQTLEDILSSPIDTIIHRIDQLIDNWHKEIQKSPYPLKRWYKVEFENLLKLKWYLEQLGLNTNQIPFVDLDNVHLFKYLREGNLTPAKELALELAPKVISSAANLISYNFPKIASTFEVYRNQERNFILEISRTPMYGPTSYSDYLLLSYIWLSNTSLPKIEIREVALERSLSELYIQNIRSASNIFAKNVPVEVEINGEKTRDFAVISRIKFPDGLPITNQVYQLIGNEGADLFGNYLNWNNFL